jgi:hypothetical protein
MLRSMVAALVFGALFVIASLGFCDAVAIWTFDEGEGNTVGDSSGNGNDGEITGTSLWVDGVFGKALYFDMGATGVDYITVPDNDVLDIEEAITMMAWVKPDELSGLRFILKKEAVYDLLFSEDKGLCWIANPSEQWFDPAEGATPFGIGEWHHLAGTYDGSTAKVYFDGELDGEMKFSTTIDVTDRVLMMGANVQNNVPFRNVPPFVGALDEAAIFNEALGADEIKQFMTGGLLAVQPAGKLSSTWGAIKYR